MISQYAVGAVVDALQSTGRKIDASGLGVVVSIFSGSVNYSRRFYDETLKNPATASPLLFPETVFNAPASHISAFLGSSAINYTVVGDSGSFLVGMAIAAGWITQGRVEQCLVIGSEETDWLSAEALRLFDRSKTPSDGAGALLLSAEPSEIELVAITDEHLYAPKGKTEALEGMREQLGVPRAGALLCDSISGESGISQEEAELWSSWKGRRISAKRVLGEGLMAAAAWQCVLAVDAIQEGQCKNAYVSAAGFHQHAVGGHFARVD
jgi:3-oxoacyl-(acyl-carrier-protein) synthase